MSVADPGPPGATAEVAKPPSAATRSSLVAPQPAALGRGSTVLWTLLALSITPLVLIAGWFLQPRWGWLAIMTLLVAFIVLAGRRIVGLWRGAFIDERNKISLSRFQTVVWTVLIVAAFLAALALWLAENVGTLTGTWLYSGQAHGQLVSLAKLGSWYLLLYVAFVTVTLVTRRALSSRPVDLRSIPAMPAAR